MGVGQRSTGKGGKVRRITKTVRVYLCCSQYIKGSKDLTILQLPEQKRRATFLERHIDQIWEDVQQPEGVHDGKTAPLGTTDRCHYQPTCIMRWQGRGTCMHVTHRLAGFICLILRTMHLRNSCPCSVQLDADLPACGRHYCQPCRFAHIPPPPPPHPSLSLEEPPSRPLFH